MAETLANELSDADAGRQAADTVPGKAPIISIRGLHKRFGGAEVLCGVDLDILKGESIVILGRSGCGKSVLLKHIVGVMRPDAGQVLFDGRDIARMSRTELNSARRRLAIVFQGGALFDSMTVEENVGFALTEHTRMRRSDIAAKVGQKLRLVDLAGTEHLMPGELSGGMRKRVALARAIAFDPEVILYDEPTTGLDPVTADSINKLMTTMQKSLGVTSVIVTHDLKCAYEVGDRIAMLEGGVVIFCDSKERAPHSENEKMRQFFETSGVVFGGIEEVKK